MSILRLFQENFSNFCINFRQLTKETLLEQMLKIETFFSKEGVFIFMASDERSKEWLLNKVGILIYGGPKLKKEKVELIQKLYKAMVWLPGHPEEPTKVMSRLETYNSTLKMGTLKLVKTMSHSKDLGR